MTDLTPSQRIKAMSEIAQSNIKKTVDNLLRKKDSEKVRRDNYIAELKACAEEGHEILTDDRFPRFRKFVSELRVSYAKRLERIDPSKSAEIAGLQEKIELIDTLVNNPKKAIKEYESATKDNK